MILLALLLIGIGIITLCIPDFRTHLTKSVNRVASMYVTFDYYGEELTGYEMQEKWQNNNTIACVEVRTQISRITQIANRYKCFDTMDEARAFSNRSP